MHLFRWSLSTYFVPGYMVGTDEPKEVESCAVRGQSYQGDRVVGHQDVFMQIVIRVMEKRASERAKQTCCADSRKDFLEEMTPDLGTKG